MNRRRFLNWLGTAAALPAFGPLAKLLPETDADYYRRMRAAIPVEKQDDLIGGWVSYKFHLTVLPPPPFKGVTLRNCPIRNIPTADASPA